MEALKNRPDIRRKLKEMQRGGGEKESKEERRAKRKAEKEVSLHPGSFKYCVDFCKPRAVH